MVSAGRRSGSRRAYLSRTMMRKRRGGGAGVWPALLVGDRVERLVAEPDLAGVVAARVEARLGPRRIPIRRLDEPHPDLVRMARHGAVGTDHLDLHGHLCREAPCTLAPDGRPV